MDTMGSMKPTLYLTSKDLKEIKDWKVGQEYDLIVSVKMTGAHQREDGTVSGDFEVQDVMAQTQDINDMDNDEFEDYAATAKQNMSMSN